MNETVSKIVELLFQDVEMNNEVKAIHDEVMDNCQERFGDLLNRGLSEDEAIAAVVESLKGMEEVLSGYPRKAQEKDGAAASGSGVQSAVLGGNGGHAAFGAQDLRRVSVALLNENVAIEPSPDGEVHVVCNVDQNQKRPIRLCTEMVNGELRVTREKSEEEGECVKTHVHIDGKDIKVALKDFSFENLGDMLSKMMRDIKINFDGEDRVCVQVPAGTELEQVQVQTTSGDVSVDSVIMERLLIDSRNGDLRVELPGAHTVKKVELHTTSGDMEVWLSAKEAVIQSMSGDLRYVGAATALSVGSTSGDAKVELTSGECERCEMKSISGDVECSGSIRELKMNTTSGDIAMKAASESLTFATVSGDVEIEPQSAGLKNISGHATSGDIMIYLPSGTPEADISLRSTSGGIMQGVASVPGAPLRISVNTISGDIAIR